MAYPNVILSKPAMPFETPPQIRTHLKSLSPQQDVICRDIYNHLTHSASWHLLWGVTGSGKTEIYKHLIKRFWDACHKTLLIVPEISLTPQMVHRFQSSFDGPLFVLHSDLGPKAYRENWWGAYQHPNALVLGTRSSLFHPLPNLKLIIMDEEHDRSYKQNDHLRYHAREVAMVRSHLEQLPIVFGSATPSFELLHQVELGKVKLHSLPVRYGSVHLPEIQIIPSPKPESGKISTELKQAIDSALSRGRQAMIYINRKGYAPFLICSNCQTWLKCPNCDASLTYYKSTRSCRCHYCDTEFATPSQCSNCQSPFLKYAGTATESVEEEIKGLFPNAQTLRVDRSVITNQTQLDLAVSKILSGQIDILVGTQMLGKGHDFPLLTVVGMLEMDQPLHFPDFRSLELTLQTIHQVAGRAGRTQPGRVFLQCHQPNQALLERLVKWPYEHIFQEEYHKRKQFKLPPFWTFARFVFEAPSLDQGFKWLSPLTQRIAEFNRSECLVVYPPTPCLMEKLSGKYRLQVLIKSNHNPTLHTTLQKILSWADRAYPRRYILDINTQQFL
jgi:primosomal protein N' (replication factor Y)